MATPDEIKLQKGTIAPTQTEQTGSAKAVSLIESLAAGTPSLPTGTTINPQLQQAAPPELLGQPGQAPVTVTGTNTRNRFISCCTYNCCSTNYSCTRCINSCNNYCTNCTSCSTNDSCNKLLDKLLQ